MDNQNKRQAFETLLQQHGIEFKVVEHPEVFTVETMMPYLTEVGGAIGKNLFLKDKKKNYYLLSCLHDAEVRLNDVAKAVGASGGLRLADENALEEKLGVTQGCVTAYALHVDTKNQVKFLCDKRLVDGTYPTVSFHPMVNSATLTMSTEDFKKFLIITDHEPTEIIF